MCHCLLLKLKKIATEPPLTLKPFSAAIFTFSDHIRRNFDDNEFFFKFLELNLSTYIEKYRNCVGTDTNAENCRFFCYFLPN